MAFRPVGPAKLYIGDPTSGLSLINKVRNVGFDAGSRTAYVSDADRSGVPHIDGIYALADQPEVQADIDDADLTNLENILLNETKTTGTDDVIGGSDQFAKISAANVPTLFLLPESEESDGVDAAHGLWLPGVTVAGPNGYAFQRVEEGEIDNPYNVTFQGVYREDDQGGTAIPQGNRVWFMGPPSILGLTWSIT